MMVIMAIFLNTTYTAESSSKLEQNADNFPLPIPAGVKVIPDIAYRQGRSKAWCLDLAMPTKPSDRPRPAIVFVHGGGWRSGDKRKDNFLGPTLQFAAKGYVCITVNYRLLGEAPMPACIEDVKCAVRWLRANAREYNVDPDRIGAYGNSAGAHLVAMLGLCPASAGLEGDGPWQEYSSMVQAVVCSATPTSFLVPMSSRQRRQSTQRSDRQRSATNPSRFRPGGGPAGRLSDLPDEMRKKISPITYISADAPPFLVIHEESDRTVGVYHSDNFVKALREAGAKDVTYMRFEDGSGHGMFSRNIDQTAPAREAFFARTLKDKPKQSARAAGDDENPRRPVTRERGQTAQTGQSIEQRVKQYFAQNDSNKDGKLSRDEFPAPFRRVFDRIDADKNGQVTLEEDLAYRESRPFRPQSSRSRTGRGQRDDADSRIKPTFENVSYGPHERNVLDFWKAESDKPTPVVIYIHGGGFRGGDKKGANQGNIGKCLANGVSFAAINYRFRMTTTLDNIMLDIARAVQFIRHKGKDWNIDKTRFAAYGGSAGGGASLWLAVHDDLADPKSKDPVLRQSTRLTVAGHLNSQATYDCEKWADIVGVPASWTTKMGMTDDLDFYGVKSRDEVDSLKARQIRKKVDMLAFMDKGDPPLFLHNIKPSTEPQNKGQVIHHPRHEIYLKKKCDELGIEAALVLAKTPAEKKADMLDFFFKHLKVKPKAESKVQKK